MTSTDARRHVNAATLSKQTRCSNKTMFLRCCSHKKEANIHESCWVVSCYATLSNIHQKHTWFVVVIDLDRNRRRLAHNVLPDSFEGHTRHTLAGDLRGDDKHGEICTKTAPDYAEVEKCKHIPQRKLAPNPRADAGE